jgi:gliding motility-associated-like protein
MTPLGRSASTSPSTGHIPSGQYFVSVTTFCHQTFTDTIAVAIRSVDSDLDCSVGSTQLQVTGGVSYIWSPASSLNNDNIYDPIASPTATTTYSVQAANALGCSSIDSITVYFTKEGESNFYLPNAFTPNNDGHNDVFRIIVRGSVKLGRFSVFDRWGQIVFSTTNFSQGWDGTYRGSVLPAGTYV